ncbi:MAG TPA: nucleotide exchange factor GrpE [Patescibacteria group bacterium]|nr:nucleotide exchange factor GrpE [Patescibacteria group bacterium]
MKPIKKDFQKEVAALKAGWQRTQADFDNYRKRVEGEKQNWQKNAQMELVAELLPVLDNFELALSHLSDAQKQDPTIQGILHIKSQLIGIMENIGVKKINCAPGDCFDPNIHEAVDSHEGSGGDVIHTVHRHGYQTGDQVLRPAKVVVRKNSTA